MAEAGGDGALVFARGLMQSRWRRGKDGLLIPLLDEGRPIVLGQGGPLFVVRKTLKFSRDESRVCADHDGGPPGRWSGEEGVEGETSAHGVSEKDVTLCGMIGDGSSGALEGGRGLFEEVPEAPGLGFFTKRMFENLPIAWAANRTVETVDHGAQKPKS